MEHLSLHRLIQLLNKRERAALSKYLDSPFHNQRADVRLLYRSMLAQAATPNKEALFAQMYPDKPFSGKTFNYAVSYLIRLTEQFLGQCYFDDDPFLPHYAQVYFLRLRHNATLSGRALRQAVHAMQQQPLRNADYFRQGYLLGSAALRAQTQLGRGRSMDLETVNAHHEKAFFIEKMKLGCFAKSMKAVGNTPAHEGFLPQVLQFLKGHPWLDEPVLGAWYAACLLLDQQPEAQQFTLLNGILSKNGALFSMEERHELFLVAVNYCIRRINSGDVALLYDLFGVYKTGLEQGVWLENGAISRWTYNNITNTALKVGETAWAMQFVEHNRPYLEAAFQDSTYYFNRARCLYEMRDWGEALSALTRIDYDDVLQNLSARALQIKIYYHTEAWQALDSSLDSTAIYLRRKKVLGYHKESVQNFIRFMRRMLALPHGDRSSRLALHEEVAQCKAVAEKAWLLAVCSGG